MKKIVLFLSCILALNLSARDFRGNRKDFEPANNELYKKECTSCHFSYSPAMLPANSWNYMMDNLSNHYGTDASLDEESVRSLKEYLQAHSSENSNSKRSRKITASLEPNVLYTSITQIPYLQKKHRKIEKNLIMQKEVKSLARCAACHKDADKGIFDDKTVNIPNYGPWNNKK
ncbi:diheme cytochrome c [Campylobacter cuniculorum]|uniref:diheme cytochrome c n=1 Tax=Campylobacter cuniculorum TaxID=374106 RepID=UPI0023F54270|nr:diheme cytochrome c [Campylobacter cuniculorum]